MPPKTSAKKAPRSLSGSLGSTGKSTLKSSKGGDPLSPKLKKAERKKPEPIPEKDREFLWDYRISDTRKWGHTLHLGTSAPSVKHLLGTLGDSRSLSEGALRRTAIQALVPAAAIGHSGALAAHARALTDKNEYVRSVAVDSMRQAAGGRRAEMGGAVAQALAETLPPPGARFHEEERELTASAIRDLAPRGMEELKATILPWINDKEGDVRKSAVEALGEIGTTAEDALVVAPRLADRDWRVNRAAVESLEKLAVLGMKREPPRLDTPETRGGSKNSLSASGSPSRRMSTRRISQDGSPSGRAGSKTSKRRSSVKGFSTIGGLHMNTLGDLGSSLVIGPSGSLGSFTAVDRPLPSAEDPLMASANWERAPSVGTTMSDLMRDTGSSWRSASSGGKSGKKTKKPALPPPLTQAYANGALFSICEGAGTKLQGLARVRAVEALSAVAPDVPLMSQAIAEVLREEDEALEEQKEAAEAAREAQRAQRRRERKDAKLQKRMEEQGSDSDAASPKSGKSRGKSSAGSSSSGSDSDSGSGSSESDKEPEEELEEERAYREALAARKDHGFFAQGGDRTKACLDVAASCLTDADMLVRSHAARALAAIRESAPGIGAPALAARAVAPALRHSDWRVRIAAGRALTEAAEHGASEALQVALRQEDLDQEGIEKAEHKPVLDAIAIAAAALEGRDWRSRRGAAHALRQLALHGDGACLLPALHSLQPRLQHPEWSVRVKAVQAVAIVAEGCGGEKEAVTMLSNMACDLEEEVRLAVTVALSSAAPLKCKQAVAVAGLLVNRASETHDVRMSAMEAIGALATEERSRSRTAIAFLMERFTHTDDIEVVENAERMLIKIATGRRTSIDQAAELLQSPDATTRFHAARLLGQISLGRVDRSRLRVLRVLRHGDPGVRESAKQAMTRLTELTRKRGMKAAQSGSRPGSRERSSERKGTTESRRGSLIMRSMRRQTTVQSEVSGSGRSKRSSSKTRGISKKSGMGSQKSGRVATTKDAAEIEQEIFMEQTAVEAAAAILGKFAMCMGGAGDGAFNPQASVRTSTSRGSRRSGDDASSATGSVAVASAPKASRPASRPGSELDSEPDLPGPPRKPGEQGSKAASAKSAKSAASRSRPPPPPTATQHSAPPSATGDDDSSAASDVNVDSEPEEFSESETEIETADEEEADADPLARAADEEEDEFGF